MIALNGIYEDGKVAIEGDVHLKGPVRVIVMFPDTPEAAMTGEAPLNRFSFRKAQDLLRSLDEPLSDALIEERRADR